MQRRQSFEALCWLCRSVRSKAGPHSHLLCAGSLLSSDGFAPWRRPFTSQLRVCTKCQPCFTSPCLCSFWVSFTVSLLCQDGPRDRNTKWSLAVMLLLQPPPSPIPHMSTIQQMVKINHLSFWHTVNLYIVFVPHKWGVQSSVKSYCSHSLWFVFWGCDSFYPCS